MSTVDVRTDDEAYNMLMAWVAVQRFAQGARRFVVNTNLNSRSWFVWRWDYDDDDEEGDGNTTKRESKKLSYTPTFGSHYFWYKGRLLIFRRTQNREQPGSFIMATDHEEISVHAVGLPHVRPDDDPLGTREEVRAHLLDDLLAAREGRLGRLVGHELHAREHAHALHRADVG